METEQRQTVPNLSEYDQATLGEAVRHFDPLDRAILEARLGLNGRRRQPLSDVAASFGVLPTKVRLVDDGLVRRIGVANRALMQVLIAFLGEADRLESMEQAARGIAPPVDRRRARDTVINGPSFATRRRRRESVVPDKAALAAILPTLTRTQVLVSDELYGLVSGSPMSLEVVSERLGVPLGEVRSTDRLVRRLLAERCDPPGADRAVRPHPGSEPEPDLGSAVDRALGFGDELSPASGS